MQDLKPQRAIESDSSWHFVGAQCDRADPVDHGQLSRFICQYAGRIRPITSIAGSAVTNRASGAGGGYLWLFVIILPHHVRSRHVLSGHGRSLSNFCFALVSADIVLLSCNVGEVPEADMYGPCRPRHCPVG